MTAKTPPGLRAEFFYDAGLIPDMGQWERVPACAVMYQTPITPHTAA